MENSLKDYLDQLTWEYVQLCQRDDKSIYGIASGKQCRKGKPIANNPTKLEVSSKDRVKSIVAKAKAIGLSNKDIQNIKEEVRQELSLKKVQGKEALKLFAKKANDLAKRKLNKNGATTTTTSVSPSKTRDEALSKSPKYGEVPGSKGAISGKTTEDLRGVAKDLLEKYPEFNKNALFRRFVDGDSDKIPLQVLYQIQGFNSKPELLKGVSDLRNRKDILTKDDGTNLIFYRGSSKEYSDQLLGVGDKGDVHGAGRGIYGNGTYAATPSKGVRGTERRAREEAEAYVRDGEPFPGSVVTFGLRRDSNIKDFNSYDEFSKWRKNLVNEAREATGLDFPGVGEAAAALGIHAYKVPGRGDFGEEESDYWVILNRGSMVMVTDDYTPL